MKDVFYPINHASMSFGPRKNFALIEVSKNVYQARFQGDIIAQLTSTHKTREARLLEAMYMFNKAVQTKVEEMNGFTE